jgi:type IV pilus assembly protein PilQ
VNDEFNRDFGVGWAVGGDDIYKSNLDGQYSYNIAMNAPLTTQSPGLGEGVINFNFSRLDAWGTPIVLDAALKAMEAAGQAKIISSPKILTLDNKPAIIKQGFNVPFQVTDENNKPTTEFKDVALILEVEPHVTPDNRVSMKIKANKDELVTRDKNGNWTTSINEAETELLVDNGATVVIGGVSKITDSTGETGFPILKEIPMIGWLFKFETNTKSKRELLIFITPRIVQLEQREMVRAEN